MVLYIFHAHYVLWYILHARFNLAIRYSLLWCSIYFMRAMFYGIYYMLNSLQQVQYSQYDVHIFHAHHGLWHILHAYSNIQIKHLLLWCAYISCASCFIAYITC
jgi:hypothetical protein